MDSSRFDDLPVVPFDELPEEYPSQENSMFVAVGYRDQNKARGRVCSEARALGYSLASCIAQGAAVVSETLGDNLLVMETAAVGVACKVGNGLMMSQGAVVSHHNEIGDNVYLASNSTVAGGTRIGSFGFVGVGASVRDGLEVAPGTVIGAGAVVTKSIERPGVYVGSPARPLRFFDED